jgi:predicted nuclease of predicted toxin-antitoxin system
MGYRLLADENIEASTVEYLRSLDHDVVTVADVPSLGLGSRDAELRSYARDTNRLILTQDDDFISETPERAAAGVLVQKDQTLSARQAGNIVQEISQYVEQEDVTVEYVSRNWL